MVQCTAKGELKVERAGVTWNGDRILPTGVTRIESVKARGWRSQGLTLSPC